MCSSPPLSFHVWVQGFTRGELNSALPAPTTKYCKPVSHTFLLSGILGNDTCGLWSTKAGWHNKFVSVVKLLIMFAVLQYSFLHLVWVSPAGRHGLWEPTTLQVTFTPLSQGWGTGSNWHPRSLYPPPHLSITWCHIVRWPFSCSTAHKRPNGHQGFSAQCYASPDNQLIGGAYQLPFSPSTWLS